MTEVRKIPFEEWLPKAEQTLRDADSYEGDLWVESKWLEEALNWIKNLAADNSAGKRFAQLSSREGAVSAIDAERRAILVKQAGPFDLMPNEVTLTFADFKRLTAEIMLYEEDERECDRPVTGVLPGQLTQKRAAARHLVLEANVELMRRMRGDEPKPGFDL